MTKASSKPIDLQKILEWRIEAPLGQFRAIPVRLGPGQPRAILGIYGQDAEIDPSIGMFFFPKGTAKMILFLDNGEVLWQRDLGSGVVPGIWFLPIYPFDLDGDGVDEIYFVGNADAAHPLNVRHYQIERIDPLTGKTNGAWPWPTVDQRQTISHVYRNFILGGYANGEPVLVTAQGTYGLVNIQGWRPDMTERWTYTRPADAKGCRGSHMSAVADVNNDGIDELMWGERCIELNTGKMLYCADEDNWRGHSDINLPTLDWKTNRWYVFACRETFPEEPPRLVMYDGEGRRVWDAVDHGHMDTGWVARFAPDGEPIAMGVRVGKKTRSAEGEFRTATEVFAFRAVTGEPIQLPFDAYTTMPVDLNGDGIHEFVRGYFEGKGEVLDATGRVLGNTGGLCAMASKFLDLPGEQILSYSTDGRITVWADRNAEDSALAKRRFSHPYYTTNQRQTANAYNLFNLGGI